MAAGCGTPDESEQDAEAPGDARHPDSATATADGGDVDRDTDGLADAGASDAGGHEDLRDGATAEADAEKVEVSPDAASAAPPSSGQWETLAPLPGQPRYYAGVAAARGRLFVIGGFGTGPEASAAHAFDPQSGLWEALPALPAPMTMPNVAGVGDRLFILGWLDGRETLEYDFAGSRWVARAPLPVTAGRGSAALGASGTKVFVAGGVLRGQAANNLNTGMRVRDMLAYDTARNEWELLPDLRVARGYAMGAVIGEEFWIAGGSSDLARTDLVEVFDLTSRQWIDKPPLPVTLSGAAAAVLDGRMYIAGGIATSTGAISPATYVLAPATGDWTTIAPMKTPRFATGAGAIGGRIYVVTGIIADPTPSGFRPTSELEVFVP